jgi:hypothetical protein
MIATAPCPRGAEPEVNTSAPISATPAMRRTKLARRRWADANDGRENREVAVTGFADTSNVERRRDRLMWMLRQFRV